MWRLANVGSYRLSLEFCAYVPVLTEWFSDITEKELLKIMMHTGNLCILMVFDWCSFMNFLIVPFSYEMISFWFCSCAGFNSLYLYKRFYRCNTSLDGFSFDDGNVERRRDISLGEFSKEYDAKKPVSSNLLIHVYITRLCLVVLVTEIFVLLYFFRHVNFCDVVPVYGLGLAFWPCWFLASQ